MEVILAKNHHILLFAISVCGHKALVAKLSLETLVDKDPRNSHDLQPSIHLLRLSSKQYTSTILVAMVDID